MGATTTEAAQQETLVHLKRSHVHDLDGADDLGNFEARGERPEKGYFDGHGNWKALSGFEDCRALFISTIRCSTRVRR